MRAFLVVLLGLCFATAAAAQEAYIRVVDVDDSLCVIARTPDNRTMLFDAGDDGHYCQRAVAELIPERRIDLLVISRLDRTSLGELSAILVENSVSVVLHPGLDQDQRGMMRNLWRRIETEGARTWSVADVAAGHVFELGDARVTLIAGWRDGRETRGEGEPVVQPPEFQRQAASIVVRIEYGGHSVLLAGATIGRGAQQRADACSYGERIMTERASQIPIQSDVLVLEVHQGSLSPCFAEAVRPSHVVFSTTLHGGRQNWDGVSPYSRLRELGLTEDSILSTGRSPCRAYNAGASVSDLNGCAERAGDDDVEIWMPRDAPLRIAYRE